MDYHDYRDAIFASDLTSNAKLVALAISYHYNWKTETRAWPSNKTLAKETSLSIRTVIRAKNELISNGYLVSDRRLNDSSVYKSVLPCQSGTNPVSDWQLNNEYNNEVNNEIIKVDSFQSSTFGNNNNLSQGGLDDIWEIFERTDRRHQGPAGRGRPVNRQNNKRLGTNENINAAVSEFNQTVAEVQGQEW